MKKAITLVLLLFAAVTAMAQTWQNVGSPGFSAENAYRPSFVLDHEGTPYVAYQDSEYEGKTTVMKFNGTEWVTVGIRGFSENYVGYISLAIDSEDHPYIAYSDGDDMQVTVMRFNGSSWENVGTPRFSTFIAQHISLILDANNVPYVGFEDLDYAKATVMKFNGTSWAFVGTPGFSTNDVSYVTLAFDTFGTLYIGYTNLDDEFGDLEKVSVMKFNGTSWIDVGSPEFSAGAASSTKLALDANNVPYVAYSDAASGNKATVMKFNGVSWVNVGASGFSAGTVGSISIAFRDSVDPYVAYSDATIGYKAIVKKFNGASWENVGTPGFSAGSAVDPVIKLNASGTAYVAYSDGADDRRVTVMKLSGPVCEDCPTTQLAPAYCGITIEEFSDDLAAIPVTGAQQYRFRVTDGDTTNIITRNDTIFRVNMLPAYDYDTTYTIDVAVKTGDQWGEYGTACTVTTPPPVCEDCPPVTQLAPDYCNVTISEFSDILAAVPVTTAQQYRFRASDGTTTNTVTRNDNLFRINMLPAYAYSTTYTIDVAVKINNVWGEFGTTCTVTTPVAPLTQLTEDDCGITVASFSTNLHADPVELATGYRFRVTNGAVTQTVERSTNSFKLNMMQNYYYGVTYSIAVSVRTNGVYGPYGTPCNVSSPPIPLTQLREEDCGTTVTEFSSNIYANQVYIADMYRFKVTNGANVQILDRDNSFFRLSYLPSYQYGVTYTVEVAVRVTGIYGNYGPACTVTAPPYPLTQLNAASCNSTVSGFGTSINATVTSAANGYRFRITNGANVQIIEGYSSYFRLNQLASYEYSTTYTVEVALRIYGVFGEYGPACTVTTPAALLTRLNDASCGITVPRFSTNLYADPVDLAGGYRFRVTNGANVQTIEGTASYFRINQLTIYQYSTTYTVEVAVKINGVYGPYGSACTVTTPAPPLTQLRAQDCGTTVTAFSTNLYANEVLLAEGYRFRVTNGAAVNIVDRPNRNFRISMLPSYLYNTTYTVEVAVLIDGVWGNYGAACEVTTPTSGLRQNMANDEEQVREVIAFPNPFETSFALALETESDEPVHIEAYDIMGKMLDSRSLLPEELADLKIGENYAAGIYSVIVSQGSYTKVVKMVKK